MAGPACTRAAYAAPGSRLPLCRTYCTGPRKVATMTADPSAAGTRDSVTPGGPPGTGALPAWPARAWAGELATALGRPGAAGDDVPQAAVTQTPARTAATGSLRIMRISYLRRTAAGRRGRSRPPPRRARRPRR